ncbi:MAG: hypothetical protein L3K19_09710 [Thermoplasmata archaeon]|nr:hypothetical protein [Thermoplasmata archaeon]
MSTPELQPGETAVAYFERLQKAFASMGDFTGALAMTRAASVAALAMADRNEPVQRAMLEELKAIRKRMDELAARFPVI